jgi:hypothetical protein
MGYTNYWYQYRDFTVDEWDEITLFYDLHIVTNHSSYPSIKDLTDNSDCIKFDGDFGGTCETFVLNRYEPKPRYEGDKTYFNFCKTQQLPYDDVVWKLLKFIKCVVLEPSTKDFIISNDNGVEI